jgi:murein DD-endopeptidase
MSKSIIYRALLFTLLAGTTTIAATATCMVSPTTMSVVTGRFGKFRPGGAGNLGSGNSKPHMHDGLDFGTGGTSAPLYATTDGVVTWATQRGSAGNTVMIKRDNGELAVYYHLAYLNVKKGDTVTAGQVIGQSGRSGMMPNGAIHLHFIYGVKNADDSRAKSFSIDAVKNPAFNPAQLPNAINKKDFGYPTDPSPHFCTTFPINDGNAGLSPILGADTKAQYTKLFGSAPAMGVIPATQFDATQVAAANGDALQAAALGATTMAAVLSDTDGYGALPSPPIGDYETMSPAEMLSTEARRRFSDAEWNTNIPKVSSRALWVDYLRAIGVSNYLNDAIARKKERVEAMLALYTSQKLSIKQARTTMAQEIATRADAARAIK